MDRDSEIKLALKSMDEGMRDKLKTLSLYSTERYVGGKITITPKMVQDIYDSIDDEREGDMFDCGLAVINLMVRKRDAFFLMKSNIEKGYNGVRLNLELLKEKEQTLEVINALYEAIVVSRIWPPPSTWARTPFSSMARTVPFTSPLIAVQVILSPGVKWSCHFILLRS